MQQTNYRDNKTCKLPCTNYRDRKNFYYKKTTQQIPATENSQYIPPFRCYTQQKQQKNNTICPKQHSDNTIFHHKITPNPEKLSQNNKHSDEKIHYKRRESIDLKWIGWDGMGWDGDGVDWEMREMRA